MNIKTPADAIAWLKTVRHFNCGSVIGIIEAAQAREAALRMKLDEWLASHVKVSGENAALQQRLTVAEQGLKTIIKRCQAGWSTEAIELEAEEALEDIELKPTEECEHSFHYFGTEQKRRRCNWCNKLEDAEGEGS